MRRSSVVTFVVLASSVPLLSACPLFKKKGTDGAEAGAAVLPASAIPSASADAPVTPRGANENSIARYANEKPLSQDATINFTVATVTEAAGAGKTVALLRKGTAVTQLAERASFILVTFKDPKDSSRSLMGWVGGGVFGAEPVKAKVALKCKAGEKIFHVPKATGLEEQCHRACNPDADDCTGGLLCTGAGVEDSQPHVLFFFCEKAPPPPPLVCNADETKLRVKFPSGEDDDCVHVCAPAGASLSPDASDKRCPSGFFCGGVGVDPAARNASAGFCTKGKRPGAPASATTPVATTTSPPVKVKCVLPSAPPCPAPHAESPTGLCQVPCPTGDCSACGGTCQKGFCVNL